MTSFEKELTIEPLLEDGEPETLYNKGSKFAQWIVKHGNGLPWFTLLVSIVDIGMLIAEIAYNRGVTSLKINPWIGPSAITLVKFGAKDTPLIWAGQPWRFITPIFVHIGILHLLLNLLAQVPIGAEVERHLKFWRIAIIYLLSGIGGNLASAIFLPSQVEGGASGAIFGLVSVYLVEYAVNWKYYQKPCKKLCLWLVFTIISLILGLLPYVDNFVHLSGGIVGIFTTMMVFPQAFKLQNHNLYMLHIAGFVLTSLYFTFGFYLFYVRIDLPELCPWCKYYSCIPLWDWCK